ncbi:molecular chaperone [Acinetobacter sp. HR7]|uniref:fimbrial biogenesis chaperone n=1 Tax=Acinetobacter sp. HR7 TaxID=1509403 RepID=UPI00055205E8|nr:fimbria/pilus periplasmic chaperone [Acinetobacter sp. HR7]
MNIRIMGFLIVLVWSASLFAGIKFTPIQMQIEDFKKQKSTTVNIESTGLSSSKIFEINAYKWEQDREGNDILIEDKTLLFNPKIFELKPESKQIVRIGFSQPPENLEQQQAWRIVFKEITPIQEKSTINFLFNFSLPLFTGKIIAPKLNVDIQKVNNLAYLNINNTAKSFAKITEIVVLDNKNNELLRQDVALYVLSGNKIRVELGEIKEGNAAKLKIKLDEAGYVEFPVKG